MQEDQRKYDRLYSQIMNRLNSEIVVNTSEEISMYDIAQCVQNEMSLYNVILLKNLDKSIKNLNRNNGYKKITPKYINKKLPRIIDITNKINENSEPFIHIMFTDGRKIVLTGDSLNVRVVSTDFGSAETIDFLNYNMDIFSIYCGTMLDFAQNFPGIEMTWGEKERNKMTQAITDGFISYTVVPTNLEFSTPVFASDEHNEISTTHNKKHSELYDYIAFYSEEILRKSKVNVNDLNPFIYKCLERNFDIKKQNCFTLSK